MLRTTAITAALVAFAGPATAQSSGQFDLVCQTKTDMIAFTRDGTPLRSDQPPVDTGEIRYTFDLDRQEWCPITRCPIDGAQRIVEVTSTTITLKNEPLRKWSVNRTEGTIALTSTLSGGIVSTTFGTCRREQFTPLPIAKF